MSKIRKPIKKWDRVELDADGIISGAIQGVVHDEPHTVHYERAAEVCGMQFELFPRMETVGELLAFVLSVRAAAGDDKAIAAIIDRFSPKGAKGDMTNPASAPPTTSDNPEEKQASIHYMKLLHTKK